MLLKVADSSYLDWIHDGPFFLKKNCSCWTYWRKDNSWVLCHKRKIRIDSREENDVLKDAKVRKIPHNSLDVVIFNRVISSKIV